MKYLLILSGYFVFITASYGQKENGPVRVTDSIDSKIKKEIQLEVIQFSKSILQKGYQFDSVEIEFMIDTFRIEKYQTKFLAYDWSTAGMRKSAYDAAQKYDSLLNKFYKKVLAILQPEDKTVLIAAQKAWLAYRDKELLLINKISEEKYTGGGTIWQVLNASDYHEMVKQRTIEIYIHYLNVSGITSK